MRSTIQTKPEVSLRRKKQQPGHRKVLVTGGRNYLNKGRVFDVLSRVAPQCVITGGGLGADDFARSWALAHGICYVEVPANWAFYDKSAGPIRNHWMAEFLTPDLVLAFPGGKGTRSMIDVAHKHRIAVKVIT